MTGERAQKRGGGVAPVQLDEDAISQAEAAQAARSNHWSADRVYEREWATGLPRQALDRLQQECVLAGKGALFEALKSHLSARSRDNRSLRRDRAAARPLPARPCAVTWGRLRARYRVTSPRGSKWHGASTPQKWMTNCSTCVGPCPVKTLPLPTDAPRPTRTRTTCTTCGAQIETSEGSRLHGLSVADRLGFGAALMTILRPPPHSRTIYLGLTKSRIEDDGSFCELGLARWE